MQEHNGTAIVIERKIASAPGNIFTAFSRAELLAKWWGPKDFSNTFEKFEFEPGGHWVFVMHDGDGRDYPNESVFREILPDERIVIEHIVKPLYTMTITLTPQDGETLVRWHQQFENEVFAEKMHDFLENAGNENLDRLEAVLAEEQTV